MVLRPALLSVSQSLSAQGCPNVSCLMQSSMFRANVTALVLSSPSLNVPKAEARTLPAASGRYVDLLQGSPYCLCSQASYCRPLRPRYHACMFFAAVRQEVLSRAAHLAVRQRKHAQSAVSPTHARRVTLEGIRGKAVASIRTIFRWSAFLRTSSASHIPPFSHTSVSMRIPA